MIVPPCLKHGERIRIVSPAGKVQKEKIMPGIDLLSDLGYEVLMGKHVFDRHFQYAGTEKQRAADVQEAIDDPETKAIVCSRGGYGTIHLIDRLDFSPLLHHPKWLVGFSDVTVFHAVLNKMGLASIHGAMPGFFIENKKPGKSFLSLIELLTTGKSTITFESHPLNRNGNCTGQLAGGNLSLLYSLQATPWQLETDGKILFIEDVGEFLYHLDRMMNNFRLAGQLSKLAGLVVGGFTEMKDNESPFGKTAYEIISEAVQGYNFPICFDFQAGHIARNLPLLLGGNYTLDVGENCRLKLNKL